MTAASEQRHIPQWQDDFLQRHQLDTEYLDTALVWFTPLVQNLAAHQKSANRTILVALNGCQGSGKTTVCDFLRTAFEAEHQLQAVALSLDDFYLTSAERQALAASVNPLLATRGVPGTHDMALMRQTIEQLLDAKRTETVALPRFDKSVDDRHPPSKWDYISPPVQIVLLEGWCLGALAQPPASLSHPLNALERTEDAGGQWRNYSNTLLSREFHALYRLVDQWIMLRAPSFECVFEWRREQERKLANTLASGQADKLMDDDALLRFIQHYERITRQCLDALPDKVNHLFELDRQRRIVNYTHREQAGVVFMNGALPSSLVFSDLDGSLLDHYSYSYAEALPVIGALETLGVPLILTSSKTRAEIVELRTELNNTHPFIVENGAAVFIPKHSLPAQPPGTAAKGDYWLYEMAPPRSRWLAVLAELANEYPDEFDSFYNAGVAGIAKMTGLSTPAAEAANDRLYSEPVKWLGTAAREAQFIEALQEAGATVARGGRFISVSANCDKGAALRWLRSQYQACLPGVEVDDIAIGDSANDLPMLEAARTALLIRSPVHDFPELTKTGAVIYSQQCGPAGWAEGVSQWLRTKGMTV